MASEPSWPASAEFYRGLLAAAGDVVYALRLQPTLSFQFISESVAAVVGYTADDHYRDPELMYRLVDDRDRAALQTALSAPVGTQIDLQLRWRHRDGSLVWTHHRARSRRTDAGEVILEGAGRDITELQQTMIALRDSESRYQLLAENSSDFVMQTDPQRIITFVSPSVTDVLGWQPSELIGRPAFELIHPDDQAEAAANSELANAGQPVFVRTRVLAADGQYRWMSQHVRPVIDAEWGLRSRVSTWRDITDEVGAALALVQSERSFRLLAENASDVVFQIDPDGQIRWISPSVLACHGSSADELIGHDLQQLAVPADRALIDDIVQRARSDGQASGNLRVGAGHGYRWVELSVKRARPVPPDAIAASWLPKAIAASAAVTAEPVGLVGSWRDVHEEHEARRALKYLASHDGLTGLVNRREMLNQIRSRAREELTVMFIDLDNLKLINDHFGHGAGDEVLVAAANRLRACASDDDVVARLGGDEFVVVAADQTNPGELADRIHQAMAHEVPTGAGPVLASLSIGIATALPSDPVAGRSHEEFDELLRRADQALYQAKDGGIAQTRFASLG